tara:strand:+ start:290 stop:493 length:204 start_codon:yes stop_codon:yes gene_type:complete
VSYNWIKIYSSTDLFKIELIKGLLEQNNIRNVSMNKKDSSYLSFGEIDILIDHKDLHKARALINKSY